MSAVGKLTAAVLVAGSAGWIGLTAGEKGITVASLIGMAEMQLAVLMGMTQSPCRVLTPLKQSRPAR